MKPINVVLDCKIEMPKIDDIMAGNIEIFLRAELAAIANDLSEKVARRLQIKIAN